MFLGYSDRSSGRNFELEGGLNGSDPISVIKVHTGSKFFFLVFSRFFGDFLITKSYD